MRQRASRTVWTKAGVRLPPASSRALWLFLSLCQGYEQTGSRRQWFICLTSVWRSAPLCICRSSELCTTVQGLNNYYFNLGGTEETSQWQVYMSSFPLYVFEMMQDASNSCHRWQGSKKTTQSCKILFLKTRYEKRSGRFYNQPQFCVRQSSRFIWMTVISSCEELPYAELTSWLSVVQGWPTAWPSVPQPHVQSGSSVDHNSCFEGAAKSPGQLWLVCISLTCIFELAAVC